MRALNNPFLEVGLKLLQVADSQFFMQADLHAMITTPRWAEGRPDTMRISKVGVAATQSAGLRGRIGTAFSMPIARDEVPS